MSVIEKLRSPPTEEAPLLAKSRFIIAGANINLNDLTSEVTKKEKQSLEEDFKLLY
ncbi:MAG: hypothetical protein KDD50_15355 [Bdellovibrionales bacterium]|nr:hypothetical protein [Bdellovibrionales bacterium]